MWLSNKWFLWLRYCCYNSSLILFLKEPRLHQYFNDKTSAKSHMFFLASNLPFSLNHLGLLSFVKFLELKIITNLPKFINSYKNRINSMLWLIWMKSYVFNILNIQMDETFFLKDICECSCLIHKQHIILCKIIAR